MEVKKDGFEPALIDDDPKLTKPPSTSLPVRDANNAIMEGPAVDAVASTDTEKLP